MPDNKKHHYVPVFYMKLFSPDAKRINLFNIRSEKSIDCIPLKYQCYRDYFYGNSGEEEKALGIIESIAATSIKRMIESENIPTPSNYDYSNILIFLLVQAFRTAYQADAINEMSDRLIKYALKPQFEQEFPGTDLSNVRIKLNGASNIGVRIALTSYTMLIDMGWLLVRSDSRGEFITGDTPVIFANPYLGEINGMANTGVSAKGLLIILPLSSNFALILFDKDVYRFHRIKSTEQTASATSGDIDQMNILQAASCYENFYYCSERFDAYSIFKRAKRFRRNEKSRQRIFPQGETEDRRSELILTSQIDVNYPLNLSFLKVKKESDRWRTEYLKQKFKPALVERNPEISSIHREYGDLESKGIQLPSMLDFLKSRLSLD